VVVSVITAPVGVSGAVFLLPIQLSVLGVPNPAVTPTNLLFNVVSIPGALARYRQRAPLRSPLTRVLLAGTLPGVIAGAVIRVLVIPGSEMFRLFLAILLLPLGFWLCLRTYRQTSRHNPVPPSRRFIVAIALSVGVVGGIYGIGGGSLLSPVLVGRGVPVYVVAPAALTSTFITSVVGILYGRPRHRAGLDDRDCLWPRGLVRGLLGRAPTTVPPRTCAKRRPGCACHRNCRHIRHASAEVADKNLVF
jgi:uncharacterized protein